MIDTNIALVALFLSGVAILLLRDWRITIPALLLNYLALSIFLAQRSFIQPDLNLFGLALSTTVLVKLITGIAVSGILAITAATFAREYGVEQLDEFSRAELRRAQRRAERTREPLRPADIVVPFWAAVLAVLASVTLPRIYPIAPDPGVDFAWIWLAFTGVLALVTAGDMLKVGLGLLLCSSGIDLLYTAALSAGEGGISVWPLLLLSLVTILQALVIAYLSGLLYGRLKTLDLGVLFGSR